MDNQTVPSNEPNDPKQQIAELINESSSIVVTTGKKPQIDEVAAAIGMAHMLRDLKKHVTAVISTTLPVALKFLSPQSIVHTNADRLRDFVIALNKDKADKLRYKVEDEEVKIFITPYKTVITEADFNFSQGDYNIDAVIALGVKARNELDDAMLENSRILLNAKIATVNPGDQAGTFGSINWNDFQASSVTEMLVSLSETLGGLLNPKSSEALLTGLVSATDQFSNQLTKPGIMTMAAQLMAAGADQQLIVKSLKEANALKIVEKAEQAVELKPAVKEAKPKVMPNKNTAKVEKEATTPKEEVKKAEVAEPVKAPDQKPVVDKKQEPTLPEPETISEIAVKAAEKEATPKKEEHIDTHPQAPLLRPAPIEGPTEADKPAVSKQEPKDQKVSQGFTENIQASNLVQAQQAVKEVLDNTPSVIPEAQKALNAMPVEQSTGDIVIDHNGDIQLQQ